MRFGDYIRNVRQEHRWTQPEAAKQIGIEQSYLSKIESGKSYPSEEIFSSLVSAYKLDLDMLTDQLFPAELDCLREISQVRTSILSRERSAKKTTHRWLVLGVGLLMLGGASLGTTWLGEDRVVTKYQYKSESVTLEDVGVNAFEIVGNDTKQNDDTAQEKPTRRPEVIQRVDEQYRAIEDYKGVVFYETVSTGKNVDGQNVNGQRVWRFYGSTNEDIQSPLRWFLIPAIMMIMGALGCFLASYRTR